MARQNAPTASETINEDNGLNIEPVEWQSGTKREPHPQIVAKLRESWANRVEHENGKVESPAYRIVCADQAEAMRRTREIREAAGLLGIGVGVRQYANAETGKHEVHYRARRKRGSGKANGEIPVVQEDAPNR